MKKRDMKNITRNILAILVCTSILFTGQATNTFANSTDNLINTLGLEDNEDSFSDDTYEKKERTEKSKASLVEDEELLDEDNFMTSDNTEEGILPEANGVNEAKMEPKERDDVSADGLSHVTTVTKNAAYIKYFNWNGTGVVTDMKGHMYWMCEDGSEKIYPDEVTDTGVYIFHDFYKDHTDKPSDEAAWDLWVDNIRYGGIKVFGRSASNTYPDGQNYCDSFFTARSLSEYCPGNNYDNVKWHAYFSEYQDYADDFGENHSNEMIYCAWIEEPWDIEWYSKDGNKYFHKTSKKDDGNGIFHTGAGNIIFGNFYCSFGELSDAYSRHYCDPQYNFEGISIGALSGVDDAQETGTYGVGKRKWQRDGDSNIVDGEITQHYRTNWSNNTDETYDIPVEYIPSQPVRWYEYDENAQYTLTYEKNDGSGSIINTYKYHASDSVTVIGPNTLSRKGYIFGGWNTKADGSGTTFGEGAQILIKADTRLFAYWIPLSDASKLTINATTGALRNASSTAKDLHYFDVDDSQGDISISLNLADSEYSSVDDKAPYLVTLYNSSGHKLIIKQTSNPATVSKANPIFEKLNLPIGRYYLAISGINGISSIKTNYSITVKQTWLADFVLRRDNGHFANDNKKKDWLDDDFIEGFKHREGYALDDNYYKRLKDISDKGLNEIHAIEQWQQENSVSFNGACYGICFSMGSYYSGLEQLNNISDESENSYYEINPPYENYKLDQTIIMYQLSSFIEDGSRVASYNVNSFIDKSSGNQVKINQSLNEFLKSIVEYAKTKRIGIFTFSYANSCHAILITGYEYDSDNKQHIIRLYDPNSGGKYSTNSEFDYMYITENFNHFEFRLPSTTEYPYSEYDYNTGNYFGVLDMNIYDYSKSDVFKGRNTTPSFFYSGEFSIEANSDKSFTLKDTTGEKELYWDADNKKAYVNNIEVTDFRTIGAYGENDAILLFKLKGFDCSDIIYESLSNDQSSMNIYSDQGYVGINGTGVASAEIDLNNGVTLHGTDYSFTGYVAVGNNTEEMVSISGDATSDVKIEQDGNTVTVKSDKEIKNITTKEYIDNEVKEEEVPDGKEIEVVTEKTGTIVLGQKIDLKAIFFSDVTDTISRYVVDNNKLASVSKQMLTGKKSGTVKITAQKQIGKKEYQDIGECTVTILDKPKLKFTVPMTYNGQTLNASDFFLTDDTKLLGATEWKSSKSSVVEVVDSKTGLLKAHNPGSAKITAYFGERGKPGTLKISANITVKYPSFLKTEYKVQTGAKLILAMKNVNAALNPTWTVSDESVAHAAPKLDKKGNKTGKVEVEGLSYGDTTLTGIINGQEYICTIKVTEPKISKTKLSVKVNKTATISLKNTKLPKSSIEWYSEDESIATVAPGGKIKGISKGETVIWTETGGVRNECVVTVK